MAENIELLIVSNNLFFAGRFQYFWQVQIDSADYFERHYMKIGTWHQMLGLNITGGVIWLLRDLRCATCYASYIILNNLIYNMVKLYTRTSFWKMRPSLWLWFPAVFVLQAVSFSKWPKFLEDGIVSGAYLNVMKVVILYIINQITTRIYDWLTSYRAHTFLMQRVHAISGDGLEVMGLGSRDEILITGKMSYLISVQALYH